MNTNIACFTPDCIESVVGQCPGYPDDHKCGRFYCHTHSYDARLCNECAEKLLVDVMVADYTETADSISSKVYRKGCLEGFVVWLIFMAIYWFFIQISPSIHLPQAWIGPAMIIAIAGILVAMIVIILIVRSRRKHMENKLITEAEATRPSFEEFYKTRQKDKLIDQWAQLIGFGFGVVGGGISSSIENYLGGEEERVRRAVDEELNKRGL